MTESLYVTPVFTKKARVQQDAEEERKEDEKGNSDDAVIYSDVRVMGAASADLQKPPEDTFKGTVDTETKKRNPYRPSAICLGLLALLLVAGITGLGIHFFQEKTHWGEERGLLREENAQIQASYNIADAKAKNLEAENYNLTQRISQSEAVISQSEAVITNITKQRDELQKMLGERACCPRYWLQFEDHCYKVSTSRKTWEESKEDCEDQGAHLVIITSGAEQGFISELKVRAWIGLSQEDGKDWEWVDGTIHHPPPKNVKSSYWGKNQPDNAYNNEDCAEIYGSGKNKWNDRRCGIKQKWICEKEK